MEHFGVSATWKVNLLEVNPQPYQPEPFTVEADWSAASYWFSMAALAKEAEIFLPNLRQNSLQGDSIVADLMKDFGVKTTFLEEGVQIQKTSVKLPDNPTIDFKPCPDLAQTIIVLCAALGIKLHASGLETLRIKETDRIAALQQELAKIGAILSEIKPDIFELTFKKTGQKQPFFKTYHDHRMAMSLAPLALLYPVEMEDPEVVRKSFPGFWDELQKVGYEVTF
jgi:3-phosphoshikimate 1-carboxyvinyltransferase